jgi:Glycerophosphoryl diester phosphodiesterase family
MTPADGLIGRLLSHRLRGFDRWESTRLGLERGLVTGVRHVEFDVRVTRDGCPVAYHDPFFKADDGTWCYVDEWDLTALRAQQALGQLATLEEMCACFAAFRSPHALLHVDVKVAGHEGVIHDTIAKFGLLPHTVLVSWLPSVLLRFHALSAQTRLCFSHLPMARAPWLYPIAKALSPVIERAAPALSWGLRDIAPRLSNEALTVRLHFHDDGDPARWYEGDEDADRNHGYVVPGLLSGTMLDLLRTTEGVVCVPVRLATRALGRSYRSQNIQLAVYSVADARSLERVMADVDPDIVYVDNADIIRRAAYASASELGADASAT